MSIIRDLLEYYRLPDIISQNVGDFEVSHETMNGYEERFYYDAAGPDPKRMVIDAFTSDDERYRRFIFDFDVNDNLTSVVTQFDNGTKQKTETYTYDGLGQISRIDSVVTDISVTWVNMPASTGWTS